MPNQMVPEYTILGSFGELYDTEGKFMANIQEVTISIQIDRQDIMMSGSRRVGYKYTSVRGEGSMRGFKVSSTMARRIAAPMRDDRAPQWVGTVRCVLRDPETLQDASGNPQEEEVALERCKWWGVNLGWAVNQIVEEDTPFTFQNIRWLNAIEGDADSVTQPPSGPANVWPQDLSKIPAVPES